MATLAISPCVFSSEWFVKTHQLVRNINNFLTLLQQEINCPCHKNHFDFHGSATTRTLSCVQVESTGSVYVVSDLDLVLDRIDAQQNIKSHLDKIKSSFYDFVGQEHISPGARVSILALDELDYKIIESKGLFESVQYRGFRCQDERGNFRLIARDVSFALPYAFLRFFQWHHLGEGGYTAAIYEIAKGISRTLHGDIDLKVDSPKVYALESLQRQSVSYIRTATLQVFGNHFYNKHAFIFNYIIEVLLLTAPTMNDTKNHFIKEKVELGWNELFSDMCRKWPNSFLRQRIDDLQIKNLGSQNMVAQVNSL